MQPSRIKTSVKGFAAVKLAAGLLLAAAAPATALAQGYWTSGHGDIGIELHGDHFHTHWHLGAGSVVDGTPLTHGGEYHPVQITAWTNALIAAPSGSLGWLGVAEGTQIFAAGSPTNQPNLGFAAEGIGLPSDWANNGLTLTLSGWNSANPGDFALLDVHRDGIDILMSTFDANATLSNNSLALIADSHKHYSFLFSEAGYYELTFTWSGYHNGLGREISISDTYGFQAGIIPEPSTWALLLGSVTGIGAIALRRRKSA